MSNEVVKNSGRIKKLPLLIKKSNCKPLYKEEIINEIVTQEIYNGEPLKVTIVNRQDLLNSSSKTVARYTTTKQLVSEKNSDNLVKLIGQRNYDIVLSALCSVLSQDLKIQSILALLTPNKSKLSSVTQTENTDYLTTKPKLYVDIHCQTDESSIEFINKPRKRSKRQQLTPYIVKDEPKPLKKCIVYPHSIIKTETIKVDSKDISPKLDLDINEDSNFSTMSIGNMSLSSVNTFSSILDDPTRIFTMIEQHTDKLTTIKMLDGSDILIPVKPEDHFHLTTPEVMKNLSDTEKRKLLYYQAYIDFKHCLDRDEDNYLPLHNAVINNDLDLLRRQCLVLKSRNADVDIPADGNLTALQLSIYEDKPACTNMLLVHGADISITDDTCKTILHLSAEKSSDCMTAVIKYCQNNARNILQNDEDLWEDRFEKKPDSYLSVHLLMRMLSMFDKQGYTPLMLASKLGHYRNVELLLTAAPNTVNLQMPNSGNTALYMAVTSACFDAADRGNRSKAADNYLKTIEILVNNDANPSIDNYSGSNVNLLLTEFNNAEISMIIANKNTTNVYFDGIPTVTNNYDTVILIKDSEGNLTQEKINKMSKNKNNAKNVALKTKIVTNNKKITGGDKPVILENVPIKSITPLKRKSDFSPVNFKVIKLSNVNTDNSKIDKT